MTTEEIETLYGELEGLKVFTFTLMKAFNIVVKQNDMAAPDLERMLESGAHGYIEDMRLRLSQTNKEISADFSKGFDAALAALSKSIIVES